MTGIVPMFLITIISAVYCLTFFFTQDDGCTSDANLASYLFLTAGLFLLWDMTLIPERYPVSFLFSIPTELVLGLVVLEVMVVWFWCKFEALVKLSVSAVTDDTDACNYILIALSFLILWHVASLTGVFKIMAKVAAFIKAKATGGCAPPLFDESDCSLANVTFVQSQSPNRGRRSAENRSGRRSGDGGRKSGDRQGRSRNSGSRRK